MPMEAPQSCEGQYAQPMSDATYGDPYARPQAMAASVPSCTHCGAPVTSGPLYTVAGTAATGAAGAVIMLGAGAAHNAAVARFPMYKSFANYPSTMFNK
jgi:hypothetical protein